MNLSDTSLRTVRLGPLPIINHYLKKLGVESLVAAVMPTRDKRVSISYAKVLGVLLRSVLVERQAIYRLQESVRMFGAKDYGLDEGDVERLSDDRVGRALDRLFSADRGTLLTTLAVGAVNRFGVSLDELHNDTTSISFAGRYRSAVGRSIRGTRAPHITHGHSKQHRPDLKQLLFEISIAGDGGVPIQFRCADGNTNDDVLHIRTWDTLCKIAGKNSFLYVADAKLCSKDNMAHIDSNGGRFVTVIPRNRLESKELRKWIQTHDPDWTEARNRPNPRDRHGPRDVWRVFRYPVPSREGWPVTCVHSSLLGLAHATSRRERIAAAIKQLEELSRKLAGPRCRVHSTYNLRIRAEKILDHYNVAEYFDLKTTVTQIGAFVQERRGTGNRGTSYRREPKEKLTLEWQIDDQAILHDKKLDGLYPLLTNDPKLTPVQVLEAHKAQPQIEKRFQQMKSVYDIAPVFLKNEARIEAFFTVFFMAMLTQAIIERELRKAMERQGLDALPIYPEGRECKHPTADQVFKLFAHVERHHLYNGNEKAKTFEPNLSQLQLQVLQLLGVPQNEYLAKG